MLRMGELAKNIQQWAHRMAIRQVPETARAVGKEFGIVRQHDVGEGLVLADFAGLEDFLGHGGYERLWTPACAGVTDLGNERAYFAPVCSLNHSG